MRTTADSFWEFLDIPLRGGARILLVVLIVPLLLSFAFPLWRISMKAPQYPNGLTMDVYSYQLVGGNDGHDVEEINMLNHYIGMHAITRDELRDLDWMPFGLIAMALLALRAALIGNVRTMIDLSMIAAYISLVAFGRFVYMLWDFGHHLAPKAPVKVEPFMPVVFGSKQIANFMTHSMPQMGSFLMGVFTMGIWGITLFYLWRGPAGFLAAYASGVTGEMDIGGGVIRVCA
jgi:copper chaperone NosL